MKKYQIISILFLLISCNQDENAIQLKGAWCSEINHCIYFDGKNCIIDNAEINHYKISGDNEIELDKIKKSYQFEIENSRLRIRKNKNEEFRIFQKNESLRNYKIEEIQLSSISPNLEIELEIDKDSKMWNLIKS